MQFQLVCLVAAACMAALWACEKEKPVMLGFVAGLTGRVADLGIAGRNGAMLAVEHRNASGGVHGRPVQLIVKDDEQNVETAKRVVAELIGMDLRVIVGPMTSSMATAMVPIINASDCILISPTATTVDLYAKDDNFFRVASTTAQYASKNARYQYKTQGHRRVAAIHDLDNSAYTQSWINDFRYTFEDLGGVLEATYTFRSGSNAGFFSIVQQMLARQPDLILVVANSVDAALICQQIRKLDGRVAIAISEWASTERFIELAGIAAEGIHVSQFLDRDNTTARYRQFHSAYVDRFGQEPGFAGLAAYDAVTVVLAAMEIQTPGQSLKQTIIGKKTFAGVQQTLILDRFGDADRDTFIAVVRDGAYHALE